MPRYYCDYCDTYLTHDSPSVRKQHNAGYKHKANVRDYYMQFEAQQNQFLVDQRIKAHLGQTAVFQQVGGVYNQMRPRLPVLPTPMMPPMQGNMQFPGNAPFVPGMRPPVMYRPGYGPAPGMPPMAAIPGPPSLPSQADGKMPMAMNHPPMFPGSIPASSSGPPMFAPAMHQSNPAPAMHHSNPAPSSGGLDSPDMDVQTHVPEVSH